MHANEPQPKEYLPLFEEILQDADKLSPAQIAAVRERLADGDGQAANKVMAKALSEVYGGGPLTFYREHNAALGQLSKMFYDPWFDDTVKALAPKIGQHTADEIMSIWYSGESEIAVEWLLGCTIESGIAVPADAQPHFIEFAEQTDKHNQRQWEQLEAALASGKFERRAWSKGTTDWADTLRKQFGRET